MYNYNKSLEQMIYSHAIKYNRLKELIEFQYANVPQPEYINIFIDLNRIVKSLNGMDQVFDDIKFASGIINLVGHYRNFFRKFYNINTKIYIVYSENSDYMNKRICPDYSYIKPIKGYNNTVDISNSISIIQSIVPFIHDVDLVLYPGMEVGLAVMDILNSDAPTLSLIVTKDVYNYQLTSLPNISILRPRKVSNEDKSFIVNNDNAILWLLYERKNKIESIQQKYTLRSDAIPLILACTRCPERNLYNSLTIPTALNTLMACIDKKLISTHGIFDIENVLNILNNELNKPINVYETATKFKALSLQYQYLIKGDNRYTGILNLYDNNKIKELNETMFINNPIILENL